MRRILIIKHGAFGDVIQSEGALHDIREHHKGDDIAVMTTPPYRRIFERCPWVDRVIVDPRAPRWRIDLMRKLGQSIADEKFDMVYDLQNSARTAFYFRWFFKGVDWSGTAKGASHPVRLKNPKKIRSLDRMASQLKDAGLSVISQRASSRKATRSSPRRGRTSLTLPPPFPARRSKAHAVFSTGLNWQA